MRVLTKMGETVQAHGMMYKAVVQSVLMYGSEVLLVMGAFLKVLEVFHHWESRRITGMKATHGADR